MNRLSILIKYGVDLSASPSKITHQVVQYMSKDMVLLREVVAYIISRDWPRLRYCSGYAVALLGFSGVKTWNIDRIEREIDETLTHRFSIEKVVTFIEAYEKGLDAIDEWYDKVVQ